MAVEIERALQFMTACGVTHETTPQLHEVDFYTSHEALVLNYEEALTAEVESAEIVAVETIDEVLEFLATLEEAA